MPKFAPVVPVGVARELRSRDLLGDYHLLLAHDVIAHPKEYEEVYKDIPDKFIIMDNSVIELGHAVDKGTLLEACQIVGAQTLALPDVLMKGAQTFSQSVMAFNSWSDTIDFEKIRPMIIPQGVDFYDWLNCAQMFAKHEVGDIAYIGIARNIREKMGISRAVAACWVAQMFDNPIHMFGFSNDLKDDLFTCTAIPTIIGIDSAVPIRMASQGLHMRMSQTDPGPRGDWWDTADPKDLDWGKVARNLHFVRREITL